jgi:hypothetical protein
MGSQQTQNQKAANTKTESGKQKAEITTKSKAAR